MKFRSIFQKIVIPMVLIVCLLGVGILKIVSSLFTETYERQIYVENHNTAKSVSQTVGSFMDMTYRLSEQLANSDSIKTMDTAIQTPILEDTVARNDYFELLYIQDMKGDQTGRSSGELGNRANRWWFIQMQETGEPFVSKSYYSVNTNMACASIFIPLVKNNRNIGIFAADIKLEKIQELVSEYSDLEAGRISYIIDGEGVVVAHPQSVYYEELYNYKNMTRTVTKKDSVGNVEYDEQGNIVTEELPIEISSEYTDIINQVMAGESGDGMITDGGKEYYISYAPIPMDGVSDSWSVITLYEKASAMELVDRAMSVGMMLTLAVVILSVILILFLSRSISRPIQYCLTRLVALSEGDLSTPVPVSSGKDESARLLLVLGETIATLREIIGDISSHFDDIARGELTDNREHTYSGEFDRLGQSLNKINASLNSSFRQVGMQSKKVMDNAGALSGMAQALARDSIIQASAVEELSVSIQGTRDLSGSSAGKAQQAKERMEQVDRDMIESNQSVSELLSVMNLMYEDSRRISGISKTIHEISLQTNLLSMNASVEAARAGEAGKGFSIIADEIRELAEHCSAEAASTSELIGATLAKIEQGMTALKIAKEAMEHSTVETGEAKVLIDDIASLANEQLESVKQISSALAQISSVVQNNSAAAKESAESSMEMRDNAQRLEEVIRRYRY